MKCIGVGVEGGPRSYGEKGCRGRSSGREVRFAITFYVGQVPYNGTSGQCGRQNSGHEGRLRVKVRLFYGHGAVYRARRVSYRGHCGRGYYRVG